MSHNGWLNSRCSPDPPRHSDLLYFALFGFLYFFMHSGRARCDFLGFLLYQTIPPSPSFFFDHRSSSFISTFGSFFAGGVGFSAAGFADGGGGGGGGGFFAASLGSSHVDCRLQKMVKGKSGLLICLPHACARVNTPRGQGFNFATFVFMTR